MKKTIWSLWLVSEITEPADENIPIFVYRHCSVVQAHKVTHLAKKLGCDLSRLFVALFSTVLFDCFKDPVMFYSVMDKKACVLWETHVDPHSFLNTVQHCRVVQKSNDKLKTLQQWAIRFEIKKIKNLLIFSFYYPEDFQSEVLSSRILCDIDVLLKKLLRSFG